MNGCCCCWSTKDTLLHLPCHVDCSGHYCRPCFRQLIQHQVQTIAYVKPFLCPAGCRQGVVGKSPRLTTRRLLPFEVWAPHFPKWAKHYRYHFSRWVDFPCYCNHTQSVLMRPDRTRFPTLPTDPERYIATLMKAPTDNVYCPLCNSPHCIRCQQRDCSGQCERRSVDRVITCPNCSLPLVPACGSLPSRITCVCGVRFVPKDITWVMDYSEEVLLILLRHHCDLSCRGWRRNGCFNNNHVEWMYDHPVQTVAMFRAHRSIEQLVNNRCALGWMFEELVSRLPQGFFGVFDHEQEAVAALATLMTRYSEPILTNHTFQFERWLVSHAEPLCQHIEQSLLPAPASIVRWEVERGRRRAFVWVFWERYRRFTEWWQRSTTPAAPPSSLLLLSTPSIPRRLPPPNAETYDGEEWWEDLFDGRCDFGRAVSFGVNWVIEYIEPCTPHYRIDEWFQQWKTVICESPSPMKIRTS